MMRPPRRRRHADITPIFYATIFGLLRWLIFKVVLVLVAPVLALMWFGQPALRMVYWTHGSPAHPQYDRCEYLALDGWHDVKPTYSGWADSSCPIVTFIPADVPKLIWGLLSN